MALPGHQISGNYRAFFFLSCMNSCRALIWVWLNYGNFPESVSPCCSITIFIRLAGWNPSSPSAWQLFSASLNEVVYSSVSYKIRLKVISELNSKKTLSKSIY